MRENLLYWTRDDRSLLRHVLTSILKNLDIRLSLWRRPDDNEPATMTPKQATIKLIEIALPDCVDIDQLMRSNDYKLIDVESVWELLRELGGDSPKKDENRVIAKPPEGLVKNPNGDSPEENRGKVVTLPEVGSNGSGSSSSIRTKTSNNLRPTKSSVNLEPRPVKLGDLGTITPSVELPSSGI
ncbi:hypothetical protein DFP73DRAFT_600096 [Morchella snyderi]|nr:hypothetical protein DFP73DRAFT_600096 [Morchella snyderi]